jgi:hypothetical protein
MWEDLDLSHDDPCFDRCCSPELKDRRDFFVLFCTVFIVASAAFVISAFL